MSSKGLPCDNQKKKKRSMEDIIHLTVKKDITDSAAIPYLTGSDPKIIPLQLSAIMALSAYSKKRELVGDVKNSIWFQSAF